MNQLPVQQFLFAIHHGQYGKAQAGQGAGFAHDKIINAQARFQYQVAGLALFVEHAQMNHAIRFKGTQQRHVFQVFRGIDRPLAGKSGAGHHHGAGLAQTPRDQ